MKRDDDWTANWICKKTSHEKISSINQIGSNWVRVDLLDRPEPVIAATISRANVSADDIHEVYTSPDVEFIINVKREALYQQDALEMSELLALGLGGLGDFYVAANEDSFRDYVPKEFRFILRGLKQHTAVRDVVRLNNRLLRVKTWGREIKLLALNDYDLTAQSVRDGIERFGRPDVILTSNPNCRPSDEAINAASMAGASVLRWGELMSDLNH